MNIYKFIYLKLYLQTIKVFPNFLYYRQCCKGQTFLYVFPGTHVQVFLYKNLEVGLLVKGHAHFVLCQINNTTKLLSKVDVLVYTSTSRVGGFLFLKLDSMQINKEMVTSVKCKEVQNNYQAHLCLNVLLLPHLHAQRPTASRVFHLLLLPILFPVTYHHAGQLSPPYLLFTPPPPVSSFYLLHWGKKNKFLPFSHGKLLNHPLCCLWPDTLTPVLLSILSRWFLKYSSLLYQLRIAT